MSETPFEPNKVVEDEPDFDGPQNAGGVQDDMEDTNGSA